MWKASPAPCGRVCRAATGKRGAALPHDHGQHAEPGVGGQHGRQGADLGRRTVRQQPPRAGPRAARPPPGCRNGGRPAGPAPCGRDAASAATISSSRAMALRCGPDLFQRNDLAAVDRQDGLDGEHGAPAARRRRRSGRRGAAAPGWARRSRPWSVPAVPRRTSLTSAALRPSAAATTALWTPIPCAMPTVRGVQHLHRDLHPAGRKAGGVRGAGEAAGNVDARQRTRSRAVRPRGRPARTGRATAGRS